MERLIHSGVPDIFSKDWSPWWALSTSESDTAAFVDSAWQSGLRRKKGKTFTSPLMIVKRLTILITQVKVNHILSTCCWYVWCTTAGIGNLEELFSPINLMLENSFWVHCSSWWSYLLVLTIVKFQRQIELEIMGVSWVLQNTICTGNALVFLFDTDAAFLTIFAGTMNSSWLNTFFSCCV